MIVVGSMLDAIQYTVQYELLRSQVIGTVGDVARGNSGGQARGIGLALLLSEGMPGWLKAVEAVLRAALAPRAFDSPDPASHEGSAGCGATPVWLSSVQRHEVTTLLASLVLSTRPLARQYSREGYRSW
jgi:hypothetical protein